jgi:hypothetical protein
MIAKLCICLALGLVAAIPARAGDPSSPPVVVEPAVEASAIDFRADVWTKYESNASNSDRSSDREEEFFLGTNLVLGTDGVLGRDWRWSARLEAEGEAALRFPDLSRIEAGPGFGIERKLGLGWQAPRLKLDGLFTARAEGQSEASGWRIAPSLELLVPVTERWGVEARYLPEWFFADSDVFDVTAHEVGAGTWFDFTPSTRLALNYAFRRGDVVSYATPPRPDIVAIRDVQSTSDAFDVNRVDYRLDADRHSLEGALIQTLTEQLSLRAAYRWETTRESDLNYENHTFQVTLHAGF